MTAALLLFLLQTPSAEALSEQALAAAQQNRPAEAEQLWRQALALDPALYSANFNLGYFYSSHNDPAKAAPLLDRAAQSKPNDFSTRYLAGAVRSQLNETDAALRHWRAALAVRPNHPKLLQLIAVEYTKGRYYRDAAASAEAALRLQPDDANLYLLALKAHQDAQDHPAALALAERFLARFPNNPRAHFELAYELHRAGRTAEGQPHLERAMQAAEPWEEPFYFYGELLVQQNRPADAVAPLRRAIEIRRDYIAAWIMLARALMAQNKFDDARAELLRAVEINPKHPQPHLLLSQLYFRMGDEPAAAREKDISLRLRRDDPAALESLPSRAFPQSPK
ncbi:MAG: tetratricopeptide repeat protein [Acidobacteriota bacterium]